MVMIILFFFPSRSRHTRYWRDWSSDVCSSDLGDAARLERDPELAVEIQGQAPLDEACAEAAALRHLNGRPAALLPVQVQRSEERRVGKESRSRWAPYHLKKKKRKQVIVYDTKH